MRAQPDTRQRSCVATACCEAQVRIDEVHMMHTPRAEEMPRDASTEPSGWAANAGDDWQRIVDDRVCLRVVRYRAVYFVYASDGIAPKHPTAIFSQSGCKALPEAMRAAEVLGEALRTVLDKLAQSIHPTTR